MCNHERTMTVNARADDRQWYLVPHLDIDRDGYAPLLNHNWSGDYIRFTICLDCGVVTSLPFPLSDSDLRFAFGIANSEDL